MSSNWQPVGDNIHEWQQRTGPKEDGTLTISVRSKEKSTRYPHVNFDYNPKTGDLKYSHSSFSKRKHSGMKEVVQTAIAYLKGIDAL